MPLPIAELVNFLKNMQTVSLKGTDFQGALGADNTAFISGAPSGTAAFLGQKTNFSSGTARFAFAQLSALPVVVIQFTGMDDNRAAKAPIQISLNGTVIWQGPSPFPNAEWGTYGLILRDISPVKQGINELTITNTSPDGGLTQPPWFLIQSVVIHYR